MMSNNPEAGHDTVAATSTETFPLMKLPAELRNNIYGHYFAEIKEAQWFLRPALTPKTPRSMRYMPESKIGIKVLKAYLALLHANHEVRVEAGPIFYSQYLAGAEFLFDISFHNGADNFRRIQAICASFAAFVTRTKTEAVKFGIRIFTNIADEPLLIDLADRMYKHAAWRLQRKAVLHHGLQYIDGRIDNDKLAKLGLNAEENAFLTYNLDNTPSFDEPETKSTEQRSWPILPGLKLQYDKRSFRMFGPLATLDWECFDIENVPWHLPSIDDYDEFVNEVQFKGSTTLSDSDGEPEETSFYDTLELDSDEDGDRTDDELYDEYEEMDALDDDDEADHGDRDYFDNAM
jgi:hypothetical protein